MKKTISELLQEQTLILKVVSGGDIIKYSMKERDYQGQRFKDKQGLNGFFDILTLTKPHIVGEVYERFIKAGVDVVVTNTANSNRFYLQKLGLGDITYELNLSSAKIARDKASKYSSITKGKNRYVGGTISNLSGNDDFDYALSVYSEQVKALLAGKVDFLFLMDINDQLSLDAAMTAINTIMLRRNRDVEVLVALKNISLFKMMNTLYGFLTKLGIE